MVVFPRGQYDRSVWSMSCSASDLKSEEKLDEKRDTLIHKRKMLGLEVVNKLGHLKLSKITMKKRIVSPCNQRWQSGLN